MRVLFINSVFGTGSTGRIVKQLGDAVELNGGEYKVAYGRGKTEDKEHTYFIGSKIDRYIHVGLSRITDRAGFYSKKSTKALVRFIEKYNPDIIHLHNLHGYYLDLAELFDYLAKRYKGQVVWTLHDCWAFTGHCTHYTNVGCFKWKKECNNCIQLKEYPKSVFADNSYKNFRQKRQMYSNIKNLTIITVSRWLETEVKESILSRFPIKTIHNGVDLKKFVPKKSNIKEKLKIQNKKLILLVSDGWTDQKGFGRVKELFCVAPKNWIFVIVGVSNKQKEMLPDNCIGFKKIWNQDELVNLYSAADVFLNLSTEETFGLVSVEAMACGTPVIVMNSTASPELIVEKDAGIIIEINDSISTIMNKIKSCFMMNNARKAAEHFDLEKSIYENLKLYSQLLNFDRE